MATKAEKIKAIMTTGKYTEAELQKMKTADLDDLIRKENSVEPAPDTDEPEPVEVPAKSKASSAVHFEMKDGRKRSFTPEVHGEDFVSVANEFHETNKNRVKSRKDE